MKYCPRCKITIDPSHENCPLCGTVLIANPAGPVEPTSPVDYPGRDADKELPLRDGPLAASRGDVPTYNETFPSELSPPQQRKVAFELLSVAGGFGLVIPILVNLFASRHLSWSLWSSVGVALFWSLSALPLLFWRKPRVLITVVLPVVLALVACFDLINGSFEWFPNLGAPLILLVSAVVGGVAAIFRVYRHRGLNVVALFVAACAVLLFGIELIVDFYLDRHLDLGWSIVTALALIPTSGFLFYLHYRIVDRASLKKLFRL